MRNNGKIENEGIAKGIAIGEERGKARFRNLVGALMAAGKSDDVIRATQDDAYCRMLYEKYHI
ncbi:MAG: hypothetical protein ACI4OA_06060 [Selenomonadaceae bacterium]